MTIETEKQNKEQTGKSIGEWAVCEEAGGSSPAWNREEMTLSVTDIVRMVTGGGCGGVLLLLTLVQIAPIKANPWSFIAAKVGKAINGEVIEKVERLGNDLKGLRNVCDEREADSCRTRILRFNDEILHGTLHTKEHFDQILIDVSKYETYCTEHIAYKNSIAICAIEKIKKTYKKCMDEKTFL